MGFITSYVRVLERTWFLVAAFWLALFIWGIVDGRAFPSMTDDQIHSTAGTPSAIAERVTNFYYPLLASESAWVLLMSCSPSQTDSCPPDSSDPVSGAPIISNDTRALVDLLQTDMFSSYPSLFNQQKTMGYFAFDGTALDPLKSSYVSTDGASTYTVWTALRTVPDQDRFAAYRHLRRLLRSPAVSALCPGCTLGVTGPDALVEDATGTIAQEMLRADLFTIPVALLLFVYMVSSWRFLLVTIGCAGTVVFTAFATMRRITEDGTRPQAVTPQFVQVIAIAITIDYMLFFFTRFNAELTARRLDYHRRRQIALSAMTVGKTGAEAARAQGRLSAAARSAGSGRGYGNRSGGRLSTAAAITATTGVATPAGYHQHLHSGSGAYGSGSASYGATAQGYGLSGLGLGAAAAASASSDPLDPSPLDDRPMRPLVRASVGAALRHSGHVIAVSGCTLMIAFSGFFMTRCGFLIQPAAANVIAIAYCLAISLTLPAALVLGLPAFFTDYNILPAWMYRCCCPSRRRHMLGDTDYTGDEDELEDPDFAQGLTALAAGEAAADGRLGATAAHDAFSAPMSPRTGVVAGARKKGRKGRKTAAAAVPSLAVVGSSGRGVRGSNDFSEDDDEDGSGSDDDDDGAAAAGSLGHTRGSTIIANAAAAGGSLADSSRLRLDPATAAAAAAATRRAYGENGGAEEDEVEGEDAMADLAALEAGTRSPTSRRSRRAGRLGGSLQAATPSRARADGGLVSVGGGAVLPGNSAAGGLYDVDVAAPHAASAAAAAAAAAAGGVVVSSADAVAAEAERRGKMRRSCWFRLGRFLVKFPNNIIALLILFALLGALSSRLFAMKLSSSIALPLPRGSPAKHTLEALSDSFGAGVVQPMEALLVYTPANQTSTEPLPMIDDESMSRGVALVDALVAGTRLNAADLTSPFYYKGEPVSTRARALELLMSEPVYQAVWAEQGAQSEDAPEPEPKKKEWGDEVEEDEEIDMKKDYIVRPISSNLAYSPMDSLSGVRQGCVRVHITPSFDPETDATDRFIKQAREVIADLTASYAPVVGVEEGEGVFEYHLGGYKAIEYDTIKHAKSTFPLLLGVTTTVVLVAVAILLRSLFVPVRLLLTLVLPMAATFGLAVLVYQDGVLNFLGIAAVSNEAGAFYWDIPVFAFIVLLGLALDYDVFIISRIIEYRVDGYENKAAIVLGLYDTAPVISAAGMVMAITFCSLMVMDSAAAQQTGFLLVTSVLSDTFIVRPLIVPCVMSFADGIGWWPRWVPTDNLKDVDGSSAMRIDSSTGVGMVVGTY